MSPFTIVTLRRILAPLLLCNGPSTMVAQTQEARNTYAEGRAAQPSDHTNTIIEDERTRWVDISDDKSCQFVVASGTEVLYNGHPTTILLNDGISLLAFWTIGHGGACGPAARSSDGGRTWTRIDELMPPGYSGYHYICPTVFSITGPDGSRRLWVFSGSEREIIYEKKSADDEGWRVVGGDRASELATLWQFGINRLPGSTRADLPDNSRGFDHQFWEARDTDGKHLIYASSVRKYIGRIMSEDEGKTWVLAPAVDYPFRMPPTGMLQLNDGSYMMFGQRRIALRSSQKDAEIVASITEDGGFTWSPYRTIARELGKGFCEPFAFRSPDGKELCVLIRENNRTGRSAMTFSSDEGATWTKAIETSWELTGDRHAGAIASDGRLVIAFRDMAPGSPTRGHYVAWIGTYEELKNRRPGVRVKLLHNFAGGDCGYSGVEILEGDRVVATTYAKLWDDERKHSIVSVHFSLSEIDKMAADIASKR